MELACLCLCYFYHSRAMVRKNEWGPWATWSRCFNFAPAIPNLFLRRSWVPFDWCGCPFCLLCHGWFSQLQQWSSSETVSTLWDSLTVSKWDILHASACLPRNPALQRSSFVDQHFLNVWEISWWMCATVHQEDQSTAAYQLNEEEKCDKYLIL